MRIMTERDFVPLLTNPGCRDELATQMSSSYPAALYGMKSKLPTRKL